MNRLVRGSIMFVAAAGAWACKTNLGENADVTDHLVATPSVVLVANTDSQSVDVEALNPQGEQLAGNFTITDPGVGITVRQDTAFLPVPGGHSPVRVRYVVRAETPSTFTSSSFTISANGKSVTVPVAITPANFPATFSTLTPAFGDTVVITAPAPLTFSSASTLAVGTVVMPIVSIAADSSSIAFIAIPGLTGVVTATGLTLPYLQSTLTLDTPDQLAPPAVNGTDDFATAPTLQTPTTGQTITYVDQGNFAPNATCTGDLGGPCLIYALDKGAGDIQVTLSWNSGTDLGVYFYDAGQNFIGALGCDNGGAGGAPETCTLNVPAGTVYFLVDTFAEFYPAPANVNPTWIRLDLTGL
jgi:hypothetical protein